MLITAVCVGIVAVIHSRGMYTAPIRFDDEGTYVAQANAVLTEGRLAPYTYWYDHPPLGWLILAGWLGGPGALWHAPNLIGSGRQLMLILDLVSVALVVVLGRRLGLSRLTAGAASLLYALTPLGLTYHRMVLLDNVATPLLLGAFILALSPRLRLSSALGSGVLLACAVLVKETTLLLAPFVLWALWRNFAGATRRMCVAVFALGVVLPGALYPLYALTNNELVPGAGHVSLSAGVFFQLIGRRSSGSVFDSTSDAHAVAQGWLSLDPHLIVAAAVLVLPAFALRRLRPVAGALLFTGLAVMRPGYLPVPYIVAPLPLAALVVAGVIGATLTWWMRRVGNLTTAGWAAAGQRAPVWVEPGTPQNFTWPPRSWSLPTRERVAPTWGRSRWAVQVLMVLTVAALGVSLVPGARTAATDWYYRDASLMQDNFDRPYLDSTAWIQAYIPRTANLMVDDVTWTSLLKAGYPQSHLVWFTKLDVDPAVTSLFPAYHSFDYVISSDIMRTDRQVGSTVQDALAHSTTVATWGTGSNKIEIRKVGS